MLRRSRLGVLKRREARPELQPWGGGGKVCDGLKAQVPFVPHCTCALQGRFASARARDGGGCCGEAALGCRGLGVRAAELPLCAAGIPPFREGGDWCSRGKRSSGAPAAGNDMEAAHPAPGSLDVSIDKRFKDSGFDSESDEERSLDGDRRATRCGAKGGLGVFVL